MERLSQRFENGAELVGYGVAQDDLRPADALELTLFWETAGEFDQPYKFFVHLVDEAGQLVAQQDREPAVTGDAWQERVGIVIPADTSAENLRIVIGWYPSFDPGNRVLDEGGNDSVVLATITIKE